MERAQQVPFNKIQFVVERTTGKVTQRGEK